MHSFTCPKCGTFYNADVTFGDRVECECCLFKFTVPEKSIRTRYPIPVQKLVLKNPFRVMGVYAGASAKEISATTNKAKAFLKVGKSLSFPVDIGFPPLERSQELFEGSEAQLVLPAERLSAAVTWLNADDDPIGRAILRAISEEDVNSVRHFSETAALPINRKVNVAVFYLLKGEYKNWLNVIASIINSPGWPGYVESICGIGVTVSPDKFAETFIPSIRNAFSEDDLSDLTLLNAGGAFAAFAIKALRQKFDRVRGRIKGQNTLKSLSNAETLIQEITPTVLSLKEIGKTDPGLQRAADTLGNDLLQAAINAFNDDDTISIMQRCLKVSEKLSKWPLGHLISQRISDTARSIRARIKDETEYKEFNRLAKKINSILDRILSILDRTPGRALETLYDQIDVIRETVRQFEAATPSEKRSEKTSLLKTLNVMILSTVSHDLFLLKRINYPSKVSRAKELLDLTESWPIDYEFVQMRVKIKDLIDTIYARNHPISGGGGSGCCIPFLIGLSIPSILGVFLFFCFH